MVAAWLRGLLRLRLALRMRDCHCELRNGAWQGMFGTH